MAQKAPSTPLDASGTDIKGHSDEIHDSLMKAYRGDNSVVEDRNRNIKMADAQHLLASYFCVVGVPPTPEQQQHEHHYTHGNDGPENVHAELLHVLTICTENGGGGRVASGDSSQTDKTKNHGAPESVPLFCLPQGVEVIDLNNDPKNQAFSVDFYSFVLTNIDGTRTYGHCLKCFERRSTPPATDRGTASPKSSKSKHHKGKIKHNCNRPDWVYSKVYCILSRWPFFSFFQCFLGNLYRNTIRHCMCHQSHDTIESADSQETLHRPPVSNELLLAVLMNYVRVPPIGKRLAIEFDEHILLMKRAEISTALPTVDTECYRLLLSKLSFHNIVLILTALLQEQRVLLHSESVELLSPLCEALASLMFPFIWAHVYVPVLPLRLVEYVQAPCAFLMGVPTSFLKTKHGIDALMTSIAVHVDVDKVAMPVELELPNEITTESMPLLPRSLTGKAIAHLTMSCPSFTQLLQTDFKEKMLWNNLHHNLATKTVVSVFEADWSFNLRAIFIDSLATIFQGYREYLTVRAEIPETLKSVYSIKCKRKMSLDGSEGNTDGWKTKMQNMKNWMKRKRNIKPSSVESDNHAALHLSEDYDVSLFDLCDTPSAGRTLVSEFTSHAMTELLHVGNKRYRQWWSEHEDSHQEYAIPLIVFKVEFNHTEFLKSRPADVRPFLQSFFCTQAFTTFAEDAAHTACLPQSTQLAMFNQLTERKSGRIHRIKIPGAFSSTYGKALVMAYETDCPIRIRDNIVEGSNNLIKLIKRRILFPGFPESEQSFRDELGVTRDDAHSIRLFDFCVRLHQEKQQRSNRDCPENREIIISPDSLECDYDADERDYGSLSQHQPGFAFSSTAGNASRRASFAMHDSVQDIFRVLKETDSNGIFTDEDEYFQQGVVLGNLDPSRMPEKKETRLDEILCFRCFVVEMLRQCLESIANRQLGSETNYISTQCPLIRQTSTGFQRTITWKDLDSMIDSNVKHSVLRNLVPVAECLAMEEQSGWRRSLECGPLKDIIQVPLDATLPVHLQWPGGTMVESRSEKKAFESHLLIMRPFLWRTVSKWIAWASYLINTFARLFGVEKIEGRTSRSNSDPESWTAQVETLSRGRSQTENDCESSQNYTKVKQELKPVSEVHHQEFADDQIQRKGRKRQSILAEPLGTNNDTDYDNDVTRELHSVSTSNDGSDVRSYQRKLTRNQRGSMIVTGALSMAGISKHSEGKSSDERSDSTSSTNSTTTLSDEELSSESSHKGTYTRHFDSQSSSTESRKYVSSISLDRGTQVPTRAALMLELHSDDEHQDCRPTTAPEVLTSASSNRRSPSVAIAATNNDSHTVDSASGPSSNELLRAFPNPTNTQNT